MQPVKSSQPVKSWGYIYICLKCFIIFRRLVLATEKWTRHIFSFHTICLSFLPPLWAMNFSLLFIQEEKQLKKKNKKELSYCTMLLNLLLFLSADTWKCRCVISKTNEEWITSLLRIYKIYFLIWIAMWFNYLYITHIYYTAYQYSGFLKSLFLYLRISISLIYCVQ